MRLEKHEFLKRSNLSFWLFLKKIDVFQKKLEFLKIAKRSNFARECDWIGKILKTFEIWVFFQKIDVFFQKNPDVFKNV